MANIRRAAAPPARTTTVLARGRRLAAIAPLRKLEPQRARDRIGLREAEREPLPHAIGLAGLVADQRSRRLIVAEIFAAQIFGEDQAVAAEILHRREEAERLDAGDPALDQLPDAVG